MELSNIRRRALSTAAHHLKPIVLIGKDGMSEKAIASIMEAFHTRELLKVKALETCPEDRVELGDKLGALPDVTLVRNIGNVYILYHPLPEQAPAAPREKAAAPRAKTAGTGAAKPARARRPAPPKTSEPKGFRRAR